MAQDSDTTPLSFLTYYSATEREALPAARPSLLGTFLKPDGNNALVRLPNGAIRRLQVGDRIGQAQVMAITMGEMRLALLGQIHTLTIPGKA